MIRLRFAVLLIITLPLLCCTEGKPPQSQGWDTATGAEAYERLWWKAIRDRDFRTVEWHLAPIYTLSTPTGIRDRQQALEYFQSRNVNDIEIAELQVKPEGGDMVVSYVASLRTASIPNPQRFYMTTVWQQGKKGWFAIAHSETPAAAS